MSISRLSLRTVVFFLVGFGLLTGCSSKLSKQSSFSSENPDAIIAVKFTSQGRQAVKKGPISFHMGSYNADEKSMNVSSFGGWASFKELPRTFSGEIYQLISVPAGKYAFMAFGQQHRWWACFHRKTWSFDALPGKITFVGEIELYGHVKDLDQHVLKNKATTIKGSDLHTYFNNILPPQHIAAENSADLKTDFQGFLNKAYPNITASVVPAKLSPASFKTGWDAFHTNRLCWGYHSG